MTVIAEFDYYSELCGDAFYGKHFLELPQRIVDALDDYFDGQTITMTGGGNHPDNVYVNSYICIDDREAVVDFTKMLTHEEYDELEGSGQIESWLDANREGIANRLSDQVVFLGYDSGDWHLLT